MLNQILSSAGHTSMSPTCILTTSSSHIDKSEAADVENDKNSTATNTDDILEQRDINDHYANQDMLEQQPGEEPLFDHEAPETQYEAEIQYDNIYAAQGQERAQR